MSIKGTKKLGDPQWGKFIPVNESGSTHISQTNETAHVGEGVHITTRGVHDYFNSNGNYLGIDPPKKK